MPDQPILYLVRHGVTDANLEGRFVGWSDDRLNETGRSQARRLGRSLAEQGVRHVFSSPVRRAVETSEILAGACGASVLTVHDLHEIELGPWKGLLESEIEGRFPDAYATWRDDPSRLELTGREPLEKVAERALRAVDQIGRFLLSADSVPAVVVTHLAVLRLLRLAAEGRPLDAYHQVEGRYCEIMPLRWLGRGRLAPAPAPRPVRRRT